MKSTYKLYGSFWDGKSVPETIPKMIFCDRIPDKLMITLTDVLKDEKPKEIDVDCSKGLSVWIDYIPMNDSICIREFFILRILQIVKYYNAYIVCDDEAKLLKIRGWIESFYNRKTPQEQLAPSSSVSQMIC